MSFYKFVNANAGGLISSATTIIASVIIINRNSSKLDKLESKFETELSDLAARPDRVDNEIKDKVGHVEAICLGTAYAVLTSLPFAGGRLKDIEKCVVSNYKNCDGIKGIIRAKKGN